MSAGIYLDYNASAPVWPEAASAVDAALRAGANASSIHAPGRAARARIEGAREAVAARGAGGTRAVGGSGGVEARGRDNGRRDRGGGGSDGGEPGELSGDVTWDQVGGGKAGYPEGRELYTAEVNAAVRGAAHAGATEILVIDGHNAGGDWRANSLLKGELDPACEYVAHHDWTSYQGPFREGVDACLMVGYHARNNTPDGVLNHTISSAQCRNLWFNDVLVGEVGVNGSLCGHYGCPVLLVTGDVAVCREATDLFGAGLTTVAVKQGLNKYSARQIAPPRAREMIEAIAQEPEVGRIYEGPVKNTTTFGAFIEIFPGTEGLCHISELAEGRVGKTEDVLKVGEITRVKLLAIDEKGRLRLSRRAALADNTRGGKSSRARR